MKEKILYSDALVEISVETILFRTYYFPFGKKRVMWSDIENIEIRKPTVLNGKFRIHGTGDFKTWFPRDGKRPMRDTVFIMHVRNKRRRIGFTVEDSEKVRTILKSKELIQDCRNCL
jgi:hypothetical protein